ncbi:MAG: VPLPA-CTERM sorting domain-containing protein [Gammaproteobacteria bacterium]|nr:VPLPA-CTERM sorting domain-containing protein [Gammaproteobacteria bacterium]
MTRPFSQLRRPTLALAVAIALSPLAAQASLVYGTLSNFDVYNDTGVPTYGFEIEFDDILSSDIRYTFGNPHYGSGEKLQQGTTTILRYAATYDGSGFSSSTSLHPEGGQVATTGHACVFAVGCEHYGASLLAQPTATRYHWLIEDPNSPGTLMAGPAVSLMAPIWVLSPANNPNNPPRLDVVVEAPEFEQEAENEQQYPDAVWAKIIKIELEEELPLEALMADNIDLFDNDNLNIEVESEWELIEKGANPLEHGGNVGDNAKQIIRRIETYKFIGEVTAENEPNCDIIDCDNPVPGVTLGDLIGSNIVAFNLQAVEVNPVPIPAAVWLFGSAFAGLSFIRRRR